MIPTAADLKRRHVEALEKISTMVKQAEAEDRDLNDDELQLEAELTKEAESLVRRAERLEKVENQLAEAKKPGQRASAPVSSPSAGPSHGASVRDQLATRLAKKYGKIPANPPDDEDVLDAA